jgi:lipase chaperone LimK
MLLKADKKFARLFARKKIMRLRHKLEPSTHETRVQELSRERNAEKRQAERLTALLAKKTAASRAKARSERAA